MSKLFFLNDVFLKYIFKKISFLKIINFQNNYFKKLRYKSFSNIMVENIFKEYIGFFIFYILFINYVTFINQILIFGPNWVQKVMSLKFLYPTKNKKVHFF